MDHDFDGKNPEAAAGEIERRSAGLARGRRHSCSVRS
jgi:hypothetical protein